MSTIPTKNNVIILDFTSEEFYDSILGDTCKFREYMNLRHQEHPELFPSGFSQGFHFHGFRHSKKQSGFRVRRIRLTATKKAYSIRPSFMFSYMRARTQDVEKALLLRRWNVPFAALTYCFGRDDMFWYRAFTSLGESSLVGTTIKKNTCIPEHLLADEKHTRWGGRKAYVATTVGGGCILGASIADTASEADLKKAYGVFAEEATDQVSDYQPKTVNTDGWLATQKAIQALFPSVTLILCFLHAWLSIRKRCKSKKPLLKAIGDKVWESYRAPTQEIFSQRISDLKTWAQENITQKWVLEKVIALCNKSELFEKSYDFPECHRTSNALDRLMNYQDRALYAMRYFHGYEYHTELYLRANAMIWNFHPLTPRVLSKDEQGTSPFERLNGFRYHDNWLQNLTIAASTGGQKQSHQIR